MAAIDLHQHLWPEQLVDRLRARSRTPYLRGWTLHTHGEAPYEIEPAHHDVRLRLHENARDGIGLACLSLSAPLGIESLRGPSAAALLDAWHEGAAALPRLPRLGVGPSRRARPRRAGRDAGRRARRRPGPGHRRPDAGRLGAARRRCSTSPSGPASRCSCTPGRSRPDTEAASLPAWWPAVVGYAAQLQAAWWAWHAGDVRASHPTLRVVFAAGAGLAPVHHERHVARGGTSGPVDPLVHVDTSSYGPQGLDALVRVLGIDALVLGSDRPYAAPIAELMGDAATRAVRVTNPRRALGLPVAEPEGVRSWPRAS